MSYLTGFQLWRALGDRDVRVQPHRGWVPTSGSWLSVALSILFLILWAGSQLSWDADQEAHMVILGDQLGFPIEPAPEAACSPQGSPQTLAYVDLVGDYAQCRSLLHRVIASWLQTVLNPELKGTRPPSL